MKHNIYALPAINVDRVVPAGPRASKAQSSSALNGSDKDDVSPSELHDRLRRRELQLSEAVFQRMRAKAAEILFFRHSLYPPDWIECSDDERALFSDNAYKHDFIVELLKHCATNEERLFIEANWHYQEGICDPEKFLGERFTQYRNAALRGFPFKRFRVACIINTWVPYFERLLRDRCQGLDLQQSGYESSAIKAAVGKKSAVAAACAWLAPMFMSTAAAMANTYSFFFSASVTNAT